MEQKQLEEDALKAKQQLEVKQAEKEVFHLVYFSLVVSLFLLVLFSVFNHWIFSVKNLSQAIKQKLVDIAAEKERKEKEGPAPPVIPSEITNLAHVSKPKMAGLTPPTAHYSATTCYIMLHHATSHIMPHHANMSQHATTCHSLCLL